MKVACIQRLERTAFSFALGLATCSCLCAGTDFAEFDRSIGTLMAAYNIPGASVAVARQGKLVIARAYGLADREKLTPVRPDSLFRIGSISKVFTAVAVLKLVEEGRLDLDASVFALLPTLQPPSGRRVDTRLSQITIRQLLQHTAGWDRQISGDPIGRGPQAARALGVAAPVTPADLIRYSLTDPLDFSPGERFAYSNLGYMILGRVIEAVSGMRYEDYVKIFVLQPAGIRRAQLGHSALALRIDGEVKYYDLPSQRLVWAISPGGEPLVPAPYGNALETWESCGAWIASAVDLVRFALALDPGRSRTQILQARTVDLMFGDRVPIPAPGGTAIGAPFWSLGWRMELPPDGSEPMWSHAGAGIGTAAVLVHRGDLVYAVLFNSGPWEDPSFGDLASYGAAHKAFQQALASLTEWPELDLLDLYQ